MEIQSSTGVRMVLYRDPRTDQSSVRKMENGHGMEQTLHVNLTLIITIPYFILEVNS